MSPKIVQVTGSLKTSLIGLDDEGRCWRYHRNDVTGATAWHRLAPLPKLAEDESFRDLAERYYNYRTPGARDE